MAPTLPRRRRRSIRLHGYDYAQAGAYYVTICVRNRECLFGAVAEGEMRLSELGSAVQQCWDDLPGHYPGVELDAFAVMPNHVHGIVVLVDDDAVGAGLKPAPTNRKRHGLPEIIRAFKTFSARGINELRGTVGTPVWQRGYYERIIRNERELFAIQEYIVNNPLRWDEDRENPAGVGAGLKPAPTSDDIESVLPRR